MTNQRHFPSCHFYHRLDISDFPQSSQGRSGSGRSGGTSSQSQDNCPRESSGGCFCYVRHGVGATSNGLLAALAGPDTDGSTAD